MEVSKPIKRFLGNENLYYIMLSRVQSTTLDSIMAKLASSIDQKDLKSIKESLIMMQKAFRYIGADRLFKLCIDMNQAISDKQQGKLTELYQKLVEEAIEFKQYSRQIINEYHKISA